MINDVANQDTDIPKLILIGRRGWSNQVVFDTLDKNEALKNYIIEKNNCSDAEMIADIQSSNAGLFPSFDEGWGLPIAESLALGTAVICSDIPAHHECTQENGILIDPIDGISWYQIICNVATGRMKLDIKNIHLFHEI